jgi:hypothetical protein
MNKSEMFKKAHQIARDIVAKVGNYFIAFRFALKEVWNMIKENKITMVEKLEALGLTHWVAGDHDRIYIKRDYFEKVFGLKIERYKSGSIKHAWLNGEKISNNKAWNYTYKNIYFDCKANEVVGTRLEIIL